MYCTLDDIKKIVPEDILVRLTDDEGINEVNQARVDEAITSADSEIDSYLGGRYAVPLATIPDVVKKMSVDIAVYNLYSRTIDEIPETRKDRYKSAVDQLKGISKGTISLGVAEKPTARDDSSAETNKAEDTNVFSRDKLKGF